MQLIQIDPDFFRHPDGKHILCVLCHLRPACHTHHAEFKKMGGRKGKMKELINRPENLKDICLVCHDAIHERHSNHGGFSCDVCPQLTTCWYGSRLLGLPYEHLEKPF